MPLQPDEIARAIDTALRDEFARAALTGLITRGYLIPERSALLAYEFADAMMTERKRR